MASTHKMSIAIKDMTIARNIEPSIFFQTEPVFFKNLFCFRGRFRAGTSVTTAAAAASTACAYSLLAEETAHGQIEAYFRYQVYQKIWQGHFYLPARNGVRRFYLFKRYV